MNNEEQGYIRVVNVRGDEDFSPLPAEKRIMIDRTNPVLGNRHVMKSKSRLERERVIDEYRKDIEADIATGGPMSKVLMAMAKDIFENKAKISCLCWCKPVDCHGDVIAEKVRNMVQVLREDNALSLNPKDSERQIKLKIS